MTYLSAERRDVLLIEDRIPGDRQYAKGYETRYIFTRPNRTMKCPECEHWMKGISEDTKTVQAFFDFLDNYNCRGDRHSIGCWRCEWYGEIRDDTRLVWTG